MEERLEVEVSQTLIASSMTQEDFLQGVFLVVLCVMLIVHTARLLESRLLYHSVSVLTKSLLFCGGWDRSARVLSSCEVYDTELNSFSFIG